MENRTFEVKMDKKVRLIDITTTSININRRGKYVPNTWMGSLTEVEARSLIEKLLTVL